MEKENVRQEYKECIQSMSNELALILMEKEEDLIKKFKVLDADIYKILMEVGNCTMQKIGETLAEDVKKKALNKD